MKPERIWQSERKMSVGGSERLSELKEKCIVNLHGELAGWGVEKKACFLSSHSRMEIVRVCIWVSVCMYIKQLEM